VGANHEFFYAYIEGASSLSAADIADTFYKHLKKEISATEASLKEGQRLRVEYSSAAAGRIIVQSLRFQNPYLMLFHGVDENGNECTVLAHMGSVQLLLRVVTDDSGERKPIGFRGGSLETEETRE